MWKNYRIGEVRVIMISKPLREAINKFCEDHACQITDLLDIALRKFTTLWTLNEKMSDERETNMLKELDRSVKLIDIGLFDEVGDVLINNPPPKSNGNDIALHVRFSENEAYRIACEAERMAFVRSTQDFIKRVLTWYLHTVGYLT